MQFSRRTVGGSRNSADAAATVGVHDIIFIDPEEGPDSGRGLAIDLSPNERLLVAADRRMGRADRPHRHQRLRGRVSRGLHRRLWGRAVVRRLSARRLDSISNTAKAIIAGDIRERMPVSGRGDEFDQLAGTLNRMLDRIEGLLENLRQVSSDVAHDLRTPLSRLRNQLESGKQESGDRRRLIEDAIAQVDQVLALFAAILRIAEVEAGETRRTSRPSI